MLTMIVLYISRDPNDCQHDFIMRRKLSCSQVLNSDYDSESLDSDKWSGSDNNSELSDDGSCDDSLFYDIEESSHKREYKNPDEALYGQKSFVSNVLIEKILNIGKITSTDNDNHKPKRRQKQLSSLRKKRCSIDCYKNGKCPYPKWESD